MNVLIKLLTSDLTDLIINDDKITIIVLIDLFYIHFLGLVLSC